MPYSPNHVPAYRHKKSRGLAVVTINGRDIYLGKFNSPESRKQYDRLITEWLASGRVMTSETPIEPEAFSIAELMVAYMEFAKVFYRKDGKPSTHLHSVQDALRLLKDPYGLEPVKTFGPLKLKAVREKMIARGLSRTTINKLIDNIRRMFKWGTENELVPSDVFHGLQAIGGLRKGRSEAKENGPVKPVPEESVHAIKDHVSAEVWAMIQLQMLTGMRPGEVVIMRGCDLDTKHVPWIYIPEHHKTEHHGHTRPVYLGPKAQAVIAPFLKTDPMTYLFDPRNAVDNMNREKRRRRKTPMTPSQAKRGRKLNPLKQPLEHYTNESYRRAIARGCKKANKNANSQMGNSATVPHWHPHQLRHNAATRLRKEYGLDAARVVLGHRSAAVTEIYAELDHGKAQAIMAQVG